MNLWCRIPRVNMQNLAGLHIWPGHWPVLTIAISCFIPKQKMLPRSWVCRHRIPRICKNKENYFFDYDSPESIGKIKGHYGNFSVLLKAYIYILMMGGDLFEIIPEIVREIPNL